MNIRKEIDKIGSDSLAVFGGAFEGGGHLQQIVDELEQFITFLHGRTVDNYLEIGTAGCGLTRALNTTLPIKNSVVIDLGTHHSLPLALEVNKPYISNLNRFVGDSHSVEADDFLKDLGLLYNLVFVDGDHTYNGVMKDYSLARKYLAENGMIAFHDVSPDGDVRKAVSSICNSTEPKDIVWFESRNVRALGIVCLVY